MGNIFTNIYHKIVGFFLNDVESFQEHPHRIDPRLYSSLTKNQLVGILWERSIPHNKRMLKQELIDLLVKDDTKSL